MHCSVVTGEQEVESTEVQTFSTRVQSYRGEREDWERHLIYCTAAPGSPPSWSDTREPPPCCRPSPPSPHRPRPTPRSTGSLCRGDTWSGGQRDRRLGSCYCTGSRRSSHSAPRTPPCSPRPRPRGTGPQVPAGPG